MRKKYMRKKTTFFSQVEFWCYWSTLFQILCIVSLYLGYYLIKDTIPLTSMSRSHVEFDKHMIKLEKYFSMWHFKTLEEMYFKPCAKHPYTLNIIWSGFQGLPFQGQGHKSNTSKRLRFPYNGNNWTYLPQILCVAWLYLVQYLINFCTYIAMALKSRSQVRSDKYVK